MARQFDAGTRLLTLHNLSYVESLMAGVRRAIGSGCWTPQRLTDQPSHPERRAGPEVLSPPGRVGPCR